MDRHRLGRIRAKGPGPFALNAIPRRDMLSMII
jgi:hypothetical protein